MLCPLSSSNIAIPTRHHGHCRGRQHRLHQTALRTGRALLHSAGRSPIHASPHCPCRIRLAKHCNELRHHQLSAKRNGRRIRTRIRIQLDPQFIDPRSPSSLQDRQRSHLSSNPLHQKSPPLRTSTGVNLFAIP